MRSMTATEASRNFAALLDSVERGETVTVTRGGRTVAELVPPRRRTGKDLRKALAKSVPPDDSFADDIRSAVALLTDDPVDLWSDR